ncbi:PilW family protein [Dyella subtropica]|uniref:PilW family protein n=1 Tax=Dyella subtropica TaxID=2992127 RepID=UPI002258A38B|nr:PilW family protein [Dyella subtropica]
MTQAPASWRSTQPRTVRSSRSSLGFTLIELMVALVLGLIVIGGVISIFLANQQSYRTNMALSDVQNGSRIAFEVMTRDIRQAGLTGCDNSGRVANVLNNSSSNWWSNWNNAVMGYDSSMTDPALTGLTAGTQVTGTDSLELLGVGNSGLSVASDQEPAANFKLNETTSDLQAGDVIIVCDPDHAVILQISDYNNSNVTLVHNTGGSITPGNCSKGLGYPTACTTTGTNYQYGPNSQIAKLSAADWYIGTNPLGGSSLYRLSVTNVGGAFGPPATPQEMVRNVASMAIAYHESSGANSAKFVKASSVVDWSKVDAVQVTLTLKSTDQRAGTNAKPISRTFTATTTVRNRVS